jgi:hypothetical protein
MVTVSLRNSIRQKVYRLWTENQCLKARKICETLGLRYQEHGNYVNNLLSTFRSNTHFGLPLEPQELHKRIFSWENVPRQSLLKHLCCKEQDLTKEKLTTVGWIKVSNRNSMLKFPNRRGNVHWYKGGRVFIYLKKPVNLAQAKELFSRAFSWLNGKTLSQYLDVPLREESRHWVFEIGETLPRFDIRKFKASHGIHIYSDKSHPKAVEVEEIIPFWINEFRDAAESFGETVNQFGAEIEEHLKLVREWQKEAISRREKSRY